MSARMSSAIVMVAWGVSVGCAKDEDHPAGPPAPAARPAEPSLVGEWTTSNAPELAESASTMRLLATGELYVSAPLKLLGTVATYKDAAGKERVAPFRGSGTWTREGDRLTTHVSRGNIPDWKSDPSTARIVKLTEGQLVIDRDGEVVTYFRAEHPKGTPEAAKSP